MGALVYFSLVNLNMVIFAFAISFEDFALFYEQLDSWDV